MSTMTILHAIRWAIFTWEIELADDTIKNGFRSALSMESVEHVNNQQMIRDVELLLHQLYLSGYISELMETHNFKHHEKVLLQEQIGNRSLYDVRAFFDRLCRASIPHFISSLFSDRFALLICQFQLEP